MALFKVFAVADRSVCSLTWPCTPRSIPVALRRLSYNAYVSIQVL